MRPEQKISKELAKQSANFPALGSEFWASGSVGGFWDFQMDLMQEFAQDNVSTLMVLGKSPKAAIPGLASVSNFTETRTTDTTTIIDGVVTGADVKQTVGRRVQIY